MEWPSAAPWREGQVAGAAQFRAPAGAALASGGERGTLVLNGLARIVDAADAETGEIIPDFPAWVARRCGRGEPVRGIAPV